MVNEQILSPTHRVAVAFQHKCAGYSADALRRHPVAGTYDPSWVHRLNRLAEGALPSRTDVRQIERCLITILASAMEADDE